MLSYYDVEGWCAGCKVVGITTTALHSNHFPSLKKMMEEAVEKTNASVICVTVNEHETSVLDWLKKNKFRRGPVVKNWIHGGRKTWLYSKQIPKSIYKDHNSDGW